MTLTTQNKAVPAVPSTRLELLLSRINDPALADQLRQEMRTRDRREFGLVFEHHLPETVELPGLRVHVGRKVRILSKRGSAAATDPTVWHITGIEGPIADLQTKADPEGHFETTSRAVQDLVAVADFADPIYPGLKLTDRLACDKADRPWHTLINAENYHALQALQYTHAGSIDTIYIDPPYNTGNDDWIYADRHVAAEDSFRHSKWLSFMERRLVLAKALLKPAGVIIVSIDDNEQHRLRMLMDQVFGEQGFVANLVWKSKSGGASDASIATDHEYLIVYCRGTGFKPNKDTMAKATTSYNKVAGDGRRYSLERLDKQNLTYSASMDYVLVGPDGAQYELDHKNPWKPNATWRWSRDAVRNRTDELEFVDGHVYTRNYEKDDGLVPRTILVEERFGRTRTGGTELRSVLGEMRFPFPKPSGLLQHIIRTCAPKDGIILDFFGGSGSTMDAVLRLNVQDGGTRQCILVTNNEVGSKAERDMRKRDLRDGDPEWEAAGVCEYVTKPRIRTILTGLRPDGSTYPDTVAGNVAMFDLTYEDPLLVELDYAYCRIAPLLWLMAGATGDCIDQVPSQGWAIAENYAVLFRPDRRLGLLAAIKSHPVGVVAVVTDDETQFAQVASRLPAGCRAVRLYESYLRAFEIGSSE